MNLSKKASLYIKDFLLQHTVYSIVLLSPFGTLGWKFGVFEEPKYLVIVYSAKGSSILFVISFIYYFFIYYVWNVMYSIIPIASNVYFMRRIKYHILLKVIFMVVANLLYVRAWMVYSELMYRDFVPALLVMLVTYVVWVYMREKRLRARG